MSDTDLAEILTLPAEERLRPVEKFRHMRRTDLRSARANCVLVPA